MPAFTTGLTTFIVGTERNDLCRSHDPEQPTYSYRVLASNVVGDTQSTPLPRSASPP